MADVVKLDIKLTIPTSLAPAGDMPTKWANGLTNNAELINDRRKEKIGDEGAFQTKVAAPSSKAWIPMVDAAFVSKAQRTKANIVRAHYKNLADGYIHWNDKLDLSFAEVNGVKAKRFKDQVNNSKDNWATAVTDKTLRITGDKIRGRLGSQVGFWMTNDARSDQMVNGLTLIDGGPYDGVYPGLEGPFKSAAMGLMLSTFIRILYADFLAAELLIQNEILKDFALHFRNTFGPVDLVKPYVVGGGATDSLFQWEYSDPTLDFHARIVLV